MSKTIKNLVEAVVKPPKTVVADDAVAYKIVDLAGNVVKTFARVDYGPRVFIKAHQFANNYSTPMNPYTVEEVRPETKKK